MKIALDYDGTYTLDPDFWKAFLLTSVDAGHRVMIVTYRDERHDYTSDFDKFGALGIEAYFTRGIAKRFWCEHFGPGQIDVWIDDKPEGILGNSTLSKEDLKEWRKK